jgi:hypothetical protein|nr:MAG TPA: hypothetical protein [Caudoviricetes sp.]
MDNAYSDYKLAELKDHITEEWQALQLLEIEAMDFQTSISIVGDPDQLRNSSDLFNLEQNEQRATYVEHMQAKLERAIAICLTFDNITDEQITAVLDRHID